jgi:hypothetical protein
LRSLIERWVELEEAHTQIYAIQKEQETERNDTLIFLQSPQINQEKTS